MVMNILIITNMGICLEIHNVRAIYSDFELTACCFFGYVFGAGEGKEWGG